MTNRFILAALAAAVMSPAVANGNSTDASGFLLRGIGMYADGNYAGAVDQLGYYSQLSASGIDADREKASRYLALATLASGDVAGARVLLQKYLSAYPASPARMEMLAALGSCDFYEKDYAGALEAFNAVNPDGLTGKALADYHFQRGFALMESGDYAGADAAFAQIPQWAAPDMLNAACFYQAYTAFARGDYGRAADMFNGVDSSMSPGDTRDFYLGQIYFIQGDYRKALSAAQAAENIGLPADMAWENRRVIGESLYLSGDMAGGLGYLRRYVDAVQTPSRSALYMVGLDHYASGDYQEAIRSLGHVADADDAMAQSASLYLGQAYLKEDETDAAILAFDKALRMPHDPQVQEAAYYNYAVSRARGAQMPFGSSVATFEEFLRRYPSSRHAGAVQEYIVNGYMTDNNYEKALESIGRISSPTEAVCAAKQRVLYTLGARDLAAGNTSKAYQRLLEARSLGRYNTEIAAETELLLGDCHYAEGRYAEAVSAYRKYLSEAQPDAANRPLARYDLGYARFALKDFRGAIGDFEEAVADGEYLPRAVVADAYNRIGDAYYYGSDFRAALDQYGKAYSANASTGDYALFQMAVMHGFNKEYERKAATLDRVLGQFPTSPLVPSALLEKAEAYLQLGRQREAVDTYSQLVDKYPSTSKGRNGYLQLAMTLQNSGDREGAVAAYKEIISGYPSSDEAKLASMSLKRIYTEDDNIAELASFLQGVPGAPVIDPAEVDRMTFDAAEAAINEGGGVSRMKAYVDRFPQGAYVGDALGYLADNAYREGDADEALRYAGLLVAGYPDSHAAENALAIQGEIEQGRGNGAEALAAYRSLASRTSSPQNMAKARLGIMRVSLSMDKWQDAIDAADALMASSVLGDAQKTEAAYSRGLACRGLGDTAGAEKAWKSVSRQTGDLYGAMSAYSLGQLYLDSGDADGAREVADRLIASQTPHQYWLARGFILLSDINREQGREFEADEYLNALRKNYPGSEGDIFMMIDERLAK